MGLLNPAYSQHEFLNIAELQPADIFRAVKMIATCFLT